MKSRSLHMTARYRHWANADMGRAREINMKWTQSDSKTEKHWTIDWIYLKTFAHLFIFFSPKLEESACFLPFLLDINRQYYLRKVKFHILWYQPLFFRLSDLLMFAVTDQTCHFCSTDIITGLNFLMGLCRKKFKTKQSQTVPISSSQQSQFFTLHAREYRNQSLKSMWSIDSCNALIK